MIRTLLSLLRPIVTISKELRIIRELYEADCASRNIYRITEPSNVRNTEVSYAGVIDETPKYKRWIQAGEDDAD